MCYANAAIQSVSRKIFITNSITQWCWMICALQASRLGLLIWIGAWLATNSHQCHNGYISNNVVSNVPCTTYTLYFMTSIWMCVFA